MTSQPTPSDRFTTATATIAELDRRPVRHLIGGALADSDAHFEVINPTTGQPCARAPEATREQLDEAVARAREAQPAWAALRWEDRREALLQLAAVLREHQDELAALITLEQGKPLAAARGEVGRSAMLIEQFVTLRVEPEVLRSNATERIEVHYRPLGVVGAITPWNMPLVLSVPKIAHALLAGNTLVVKPSPYAPLATLRLAELARKLFPPGVLNVLAGGNAFGQWMSEHPGIAKISFTGSIPTGRRVMGSAAGTLKRLTLELGGNDPAIVLPDADIDAIAQRLYDAVFVNCGQVCMAIKRLYVPDALYEKACEALAGIAREARVGDPFDPATQLGPVQNRAQFDIVQAVLEDTRARAGARILTGGKALSGPGYFIEPTVVADIAEGARMVDEEPFGPVLPIIRYTDVDDAVARANAGPHGLGASVWGTDVARACEVASRLHAGTVWVNRHVGADPLAPFGGAKQSGVGRQYGLTGLKGYMEAITMVLPPAA
ncbi:aldehyde dehydrogenase family protein [Ramlibacter rhizophilus]|uniref:4-(hydroxymethyl)benzenesulfonate dehydrogenase n=1 Tax=Ramlibacter rhizophilus TaxID=1781167 RepID=A0A4Z0BKI1_9BURK|nr:aldehyde dehydrogenase family protein [Ramlibacter rhizophilus]TFY99825.1 aldehyde dehydrogenase family protein [Ramlibacter rhizophilus]